MNTARNHFVFPNDCLKAIVVLYYSYGRNREQDSEQAKKQSDEAQRH